MACSQAILTTFGTQFGLDEDLALRLASGFGGGMGRLANTCGAVTGAFMVLDLKYASSDVSDKESKELTRSRIREFAARFEERNRSVMCRDILGEDISTEEGFIRGVKSGLAKEKCPKFVRDAAEILEEMLQHNCT
jgi:C_GCAxxG_C_C family probable redox protein